MPVSEFQGTYLQFVQVLVKGAGKKRSQTQIITKASGLKTLARSVGRKNRPSIARQAMKDGKIKEIILSILSKQVQKEMTHMCSKKTSSVLRNTTSPDVLSKFSWDTIAEELRRHAPTLQQVLKGFTNVKRYKGGRKRKTNLPTNTAIVGVCASILLRHKNIHMNLLQKIVSLILNCGHASKLVRHS